MLGNPIEVKPSKLLYFKQVKELVDSLRRGGCLVLPADTGYMFAVDACNEESVIKLFQAKKRVLNNPIHVAVSTLEQVKQIVEVDIRVERLSEQFMPGPITLVSKYKKSSVSEILMANTGYLGVRIPDSPLISQICSYFGRPLTATSVNISGHTPLTNVEDIITSFKEYIDFIVYSNSDFLYSESSTVVKMLDQEIQILRKDPISKEDILQCSQKLSYSEIQEWT